MQKILHTMLRVGDLDRSLDFYTNKLGMTLFRKENYPDGRFTLAFVGYGTEENGCTIELTYNWDHSNYVHGTAYGHIALAVTDAQSACDDLDAAGVKIIRPAGPMKSTSPDCNTPEIIAFLEDPDGYRIELIESSST